MGPRSISGVIALIASLTFADAVRAVGVSKTFAPQLGSWLEDANWTPTGIPGEQDDATIGSNRSADLRSPTTVRNFTLNTGRLDGEGVLNITERFHWVDGVMDNSFGGVGTLNVEQGMDLAPGAIVYRGARRRQHPPGLACGRLRWRDPNRLRAERRHLGAGRLRPPRAGFPP